MTDLGAFAPGFASWHKVLASGADLTARMKLFCNAAKDVARYVTRGLDQTVIADELQSMAEAHGLMAQFGADAVQSVLAEAFDDIERVPDFLGDPLTNGHDKHPPPVVRATSYQIPNEETHPQRSWMHAMHYVRTFCTATVGPGGCGKTTLALYEAITMAVAGFRVWYLSGEDPKEEIDRRIMAHCKRHSITQEQIAGRLFVDDKETFALALAKHGKKGVEFDETWLLQFEEAIQADSIDAVILDPFVSFHKVPEFDNGAMDQLVKRLAAIATRCNCNIELSHHVRKPAYGQTEMTVDDTRGGSAIINAVRSSRVINRMSEREADQAQIKYDERSSYLRIDKGKRNMTPPEAATWFHLLSVHLLNGDNVQAIEPWSFPKAFDGLCPADVSWVQNLLQEQPRRASSQSPDWLGHHLGKRFNRDTTEKHGAIWANKIIGEWLRNGVFKKVPLRDPETRKPNVPYYAHNDYQRTEAVAVVVPSPGAGTAAQEQDEHGQTTDQ